MHPQKQNCDRNSNSCKQLLYYPTPIKLDNQSSPQEEGWSSHPSFEHLVIAKLECEGKDKIEF